MKIEHLAIWVKDLEKMRAFYETYFGLKSGHKYHNPDKNFTSYFLNLGDGPRLELMHRPAITERPFAHEEHIGINHFAISVGSQEKVDELTEVLKNSGHEIVGKPRTTGDGYYESVILDPEKNRVEITV